jgi:hypothetical protein
MFKDNKKKLRFYFTLIVLVLSTNISFGQESLDGIWKSVYELESYPEDSLISYTRIFFIIDGNSASIKNYDRAMDEKEIFANTFILNKEEQNLVFDEDTSDVKKYKFEFKNGFFDVTFSEEPSQIIRFKKLEKFGLGDQDKVLTDFLVNNAIKGTFTYYDEDLHLEFFEDHKMWVTNSLKSYLTVLNRWNTFKVDNELFIYLSDFGPMVQVTDISDERIDFIDEYDQKYTGHFSKAKTEIKFDKNNLIGVWEQERTDTTGIAMIPRKMGNRDFYMNEFWDFQEEKATKYHRFFVRETEWETSRNGELILLKSTEDQRFRILSLDDNRLVVERSDIYGSVYQDSFIRKKSVPNPKPFNKYD